MNSDITEIANQQRAMQTNLPPQTNNKLKRKYLWIILGIGLILIVLSVAYLIYNNSQSQVRETTQSLSTSNSSDAYQADKNKVLSITEEILELTKNKEFENALPYFIYGKEDHLSEVDILTALALTESAYKENDIFDPIISLDDIEVIDEKAQVVVYFIINKQKSSIRYDFLNINQNWKIDDITFGGSLDLKKTVEEKSTTSETFSDASYSSSPKTFTLPNQDTFEIQQTLISDRSDGIVFRINQPKLGYVFAASDSSHIKSYKEIAGGRLYTGFHKIDLDDFKENSGIFVVYPEGVEIKLYKSEITTKPLVEIPFRIQNSD